MVPYFSWLLFICVACLLYHLFMENGKHHIYSYTLFLCCLSHASLAHASAHTCCLLIIWSLITMPAMVAPAWHAMAAACVAVHDMQQETSSIQSLCLSYAACMPSATSPWHTVLPFLTFLPPPVLPGRRDWVGRRDVGERATRRPRALAAISPLLIGSKAAAGSANAASRA